MLRAGSAPSRNAPRNLPRNIIRLARFVAGAAISRNPQPDSGIVSRLSGPGAAGSVRVHRPRSQLPAMPCPPRRSPPDPRRSWPRPTGMLPTTALIGGSGLAPATPARAVAAVARWWRPGVPEPPPSSSPPQTTTPAAAPLLGPKADRPRRPATGQCPLAAPYGRPGHSPPGASVRMWRRRNLCSSA